ncbi:MAG: trypsin-like peptidase domain-containing protein [Acidobacteriaceae bacterium]|nr:trypsin-like peptidase domain-containing protein [Acidobacteriaceae bacterium]
MKTLALSLSFLVFAGVTAAADSPQLSADEHRILETSPAVVFIQVWYTGVIQFAGHEPREFVKLTSTGTGFLYRPDGYIITNAHVVQDANIKDETARNHRMGRVVEQAKLFIKQNQIRDRVAGLDTTAPHFEIFLNNHTSYTGEIKVYSDPSFVNNGKDIAIIKIDANNLPTVKLGNSDDVHVGEPVEVIGYPGVAMNSEIISKQSELVPSVTNGHLSAVKVDYKGTPVLQSDAAITHGNSGGPAFDPDGKVIGIATYGNEEQIAGFNFFVPINTALEFVRQAGAEPQSGEFDKTWANALDAYQQGDWGSAHRLLADVLSMMPNQPDAARLENVAAHNERNETSFDRMRRGGGALLWPIVGIVVVLILALIVWRMAASRKPVLATAGGPPIPPPHFATAPPPSAPAAAPAPAPTKVLPPSSPASSSQAFGVLQVTAGVLNGNRFPVPKAGVLIGRDSAKCNIVIADDTVSKEHAWVVPVDNEVVVIDRGSSNGTYLNSTDSPRINKVALKNGDRIFIGKKGAAVLTYFS